MCLILIIIQTSWLPVEGFYILVDRHVKTSSFDNQDQKVNAVQKLILKSSLSVTILESPPG